MTPPAATHLGAPSAVPIETAKKTLFSDISMQTARRSYQALCQHVPTLF